MWAKMQSDLSIGGNDRLDSLESQEVEASSKVSVCLSVLSFYLAMWNADMKLENKLCGILFFFPAQLRCLRSNNLNMSVTSMLP